MPRKGSVTRVKKEKSLDYLFFGANQTNVLLGTHTKYTHGDLCD
jgi:hypothetical protein